jgi:hypothetical protein
VSSAGHMTGVIMRPDPSVEIEVAKEKAVRRQRHAARMAEIERLDGELLDIYLEQRVLYRQLVREGQHRRVPPPEKPKYRTARRQARSSSGPDLTRSQVRAKPQTDDERMPTVRIFRSGSGEILRVR